MAPNDPVVAAPKWPRLIQNTVSFLGIIVALTSLACILFLFVIDSFSELPNPYIGIFAYIVLPGVLIVGILIIIAGMLRERRWRRKHAPGEVPKYPRLDFNDPRQRAAATGIVVFGVVFAMLSAIGSYRAYEYSDSVQFCGTLCHGVMNPEYTAYLNSPHARVACVDCHVGSGAGWYVRSKLSGAYQLYAYSFNKYPRPIKTPVANLRPAQDTCEQCHWPRKFHGQQLRAVTHYASDEKNTPRQIRMLIKTGGGDPETGLATGIHWHMNIANEITYVTTDAQHQVIPWMRVRSQDGKVTEYMAKDANLTPQQIESMPKHRMDCVSCHNRPSHIYVPPERSVDQSLLAARLDPGMPFIKQQAVAALAASYNDTDAAMKGIAKSLTDFYASRPEVPREKVEGAIKEVQRIYSVTIFPEMKTDWRTHPNNIGHFYSPGCYRCHDDNHVNNAGKAVSRDCQICHTILEQEKGPAAPAHAVQGVGFEHPIDLGDLRAVNCTDCHTGAGQ